MKRYALIGYPLAHSFSAGYFTEKFAAEGIDASYINCPIKNIDDLPALLDEMGPFDGFNVTIPYKELIIPYLDELDHIATEVGAVNLVKIGFREGKRWLKGFNTDVSGFIGSLEHNGIFAPGNSLVLGTGGASKAVTYALRRAGFSVATVSRRAGAGDFTYSELEEKGMGEFDLIVNTTPLGMYPVTDIAPPVPFNTLKPSAVMYDLVYNPEESVFLRYGREFGCKTINGLKMLYIQAEKGWVIWQSPNR